MSCEPMTTCRHIGHATLILLTAAIAVADSPALPADLVGRLGNPSLAWQLDGFGGEPSVAGFNDDGRPLLLVASRRLGDAPPLRGDLTLVSPRGWVVRRIALPRPAAGLPAMIRRTIAATDAGGLLHLFSLAPGASESLHPRLEGAGGAVAGPLIVGANLVWAGGSTVTAVDELLHRRWQVEVGAEVTVPLASDGRSIYAAGRLLTALDAETGQLRWRIDPGAEAQTGLLASAGLIIAGFADQTLRGYDTADGAEIWRLPCQAGRFAAHLALAGPWLVAATESGRLLGVEAAGGELVWQAERPGPLSSPAVAFGHLFVTGGGQLHAVPFDSRQPGWSFAATLDDGRTLALTADPSIYGRRVYAGSAEGELVGIDLADPVGPAPWPLPGGTIWRNGRAVPPDEAS